MVDTKSFPQKNTGMIKDCACGCGRKVSVLGPYARTNDGGVLHSRKCSDKYEVTKPRIGPPAASPAT